MNPGNLALAASPPDEFVSIVSPLALVGKVCDVLCRKKIVRDRHRQHLSTDAAAFSLCV